MYGKVSISERHVPDQHKSHRPCALGGHAGGDKYIVGANDSLLFKFAQSLDSQDPRRTYECDRIAAKEASHALLGLAALHVAGPGCAGSVQLWLPLGLTIDYLGSLS